MSLLASAVEAHYWYDGDGMLVKSQIDGVVTYYAGRHYHLVDNAGVETERKFYTVGSSQVAVRTITGGQDTLTWILSDHLGSTSVTANADGTLKSETKYTAFGETRPDTGTSDTPYQYTGQLSQMEEIGLYYYVARWMDPVTAHFAQADTIVPNPQSSKAYDRFGYANNNPIIYADPDGHNPLLIIAVLALGAIALTGDTADTSSLPRIWDYKDCYAGFNEIAAARQNDVQALVTMFTSDQLPGETASERLNAILTGADDGMGTYFHGDFGDTGFQSRFKDGEDQFGHFLQGVGIASSVKGPIPDYLGKSLMTGHEMRANPSNEYSPAMRHTVHAAQFAWGAVHPNVTNGFTSGTEEAFNNVINANTRSTNRAGNSVEDVRLSYYAWIFGKAIQTGAIQTRYQAASWISTNLAEKRGRSGYTVVEY